MSSGHAASGRLGYLLKHAQYRMAELNEKALTPFGVDGRELGVLLVIAGHEPQSQQQVAQRLGVDRTTMVALLDTLERKGLVARRPHPEDRRRNVVELTGAGTETLERATEASDRAEREFLAPLGERGARQLRDALRAVVLPEGQSSIGR
ncbi:MarR family winged helix-turn-helix transcriptional regulator [Virgisporangium aliadipatigenens]|uniref:MarR family winged helix-turn-helix transcriptional regulator n=1 Tax=Virgisporangium aliadipatigenens TaxID=741659 RepID=UPI001EF3887C|nr:MarR family transcriptional regulator [Virgisporangium aliadipatigenens]